MLHFLKSSVGVQPTLRTSRATLRKSCAPLSQIKHRHSTNFKNNTCSASSKSSIGVQSTSRTSRALVPQIKHRRSTNFKKITCCASSKSSIDIQPTLRTSRAPLPQIKRRRSTNLKNTTCSASSKSSVEVQPKENQILKIKPQHIKSTKLEHQLKFNSTNQMSLEISCEQACFTTFYFWKLATR